MRRNIHLTSTLYANTAGKLPTGCGKEVAKSYATVFIEDAGCPKCLANPAAVAAAELLQVEIARASYFSRLNCLGKVAAHAAAGDDVSDCDEGFHCGRRHVGACKIDGEPFDLNAFLTLDTRAKPDEMKFCDLCRVTVLHAGGRDCLSPNHARNAERANR